MATKQKVKGGMLEHKAVRLTMQNKKTGPTIENVVNNQTLEMNLTDRKVGKRGIVVDTVKDRIRNANLGAVDKIIQKE